MPGFGVQQLGHRHLNVEHLITNSIKFDDACGDDEDELVGCVA